MGLSKAWWQGRALSWGENKSRHGMLVQSQVPWEDLVVAACAMMASSFGPATWQGGVL